MADQYRRKKGSDAWHFCSNCRNWPEGAGTYDVSYSKPTSGEFCDECLAKKKANNCN